MKIVARIITRGTGDDGQGTVDLVIGLGFKQGGLKPNTIYEIVDVMGDGELQINEVGPMNRDIKMWFKSADDIIDTEFPYAILTEKEVKLHMEKKHAE